MNISQLLHNENNSQSISHWPVFVINQIKHSWYFYSVKGLTLRKKPQNTSIVGFLQSHLNADPLKKQQQRGQNNKQSKYTILQARQIDRRQPKDSELNTIKIKKFALSQILTQTDKSDEKIIRDQEWKPNLNEQISLYKIQNIEQNKLHNLLWSQNIISCKAPITSFLQQKLNKYAELICQRAQQKILKNLVKIKQFEIIFTYDSKSGKIKIVFAHNFKISPLLVSKNQERESTLSIGANDLQKQNNKILQAKQMYWSDLKIGQDDYQYIELLMEEQGDNRINKIKQEQNQIMKNKQNNEQKILQDILRCNQLQEQNRQQSEQDKIQEKRLKYIRVLQKLQNEQNQFTHKLNVALKKQAQIAEVREFQCSACRACVRVGQFQCQKMVSSHRIPEIQIQRQVKMKGNNIGLYELVPVCQLCYNKFKQIVQRKVNTTKTLTRNSSHRSNSKQKNLKNQAKLNTLVYITSQPRNQPNFMPITNAQNKRAQSVSNYTRQNKTSITKTTAIKQSLMQMGAKNRNIETPSLDANSLQNTELDDQKYGFLFHKAKKEKFRKCSFTHNNTKEISVTHQQKSIPRNSSKNKTSLSRSTNQNKKSISNHVAYVNTITDQQNTNSQNKKMKAEVKESIDTQTNDQIRNALLQYEDDDDSIGRKKQKVQDNITSMLNRINSKKYQKFKYKLGKHL